MVGLLVLLTVEPVCAYAQASAADSVAGQRARLGRRGAGLRAGIWNVSAQPAAARESPSFEAYFQRGLDDQLSLENSAGIWWVRHTTSQLGGDVETKSFVIPVLTSLKLYPLTRAADKLEPFITAGAGFALGIEDEDETAIGGGGTSLVTGFGLRAGGGAELDVRGKFGLSALIKYQWIRFGQEVGDEDTFRGLAMEAGLTFRFGPATVADRPQ